MIRRSVFLVSAFVALSTHTSAANFDRQTFLAAVKERFKSEPALMELRSIYDPILKIQFFPAKTEGWQKNLITIPSIGQNASFGIALGYLASQELRIRFSSRGGPFDAVVGVDANQVITSLNQIPAWGDVLLRTVFDEKSSCTIDRNVFRNSPADLEFANSLCRDLKRVLAEAKSEFKDQQLLASEKRTDRTAIQRIQDLLKQAIRYENESVVQASITSLQSALSGSDLSEIRAKSQRLTAAGRDLEQFIAAQRVKTEALANARQAANQELTRTQTLVSQAQGYGKQSQIASAQKPLELALDGENVEDIKTKTQALTEVNRDLNQYIQDQRTAAEKKRQQENDIRAFVATKQRVDKAIESAKAEIGNANKLSGDKALAAATKEANQAVSELAAKLQNDDPKDAPQISALADRLAKAEQNLKLDTRQATVLSTATGKRVYQGCVVWATRKGMTASVPVRIFKDDATNQAADLAANMGTHLCRCMAAEIAGDTEITDEAKVEIGRQFETRDRMDNQALAVVVGVASTKCQVQAMERIANQK